MSRFTLTLAATLTLIGAASAQPAKLEVQPDSLPFGTLYTDAIAEGSVLIFASADDPKPKIKTDGPKFVKVLRTDTHEQEFGNRGKFTCVTVEVAIDTAKAGELKGELEVTINKDVVKVPISATVKARKPGAPRVLVVGSPFERYTTGFGKDYQGWRDVVDAAGLDASYILVHNGKATTRDLDLSKFDCILMSADALVDPTDDDVKRVRAFAEKGGRVVVTANAFFVGSVKGANKVLDGYGVTILDTEAPNAKEIVLQKENFDAAVTKAGVEKAKFFRASPVSAEKGAKLLVSSPEFDQPNYGYVAVGKAGKGEVIAMGVSLWWNWVGEQRGKDSDNGKLLGYLLTPSRKG
jgi:hypothetical protein